MILALVGPTATGKSALAMKIAQTIGAEICCADSMTVYAGMDIGTAKPSRSDRALVPHHLLDLADPLERFTAARFQRAARAAFDDISSRSAHALIVGGSGLYVRAALDPLEFPPDDAVIRARLEEMAPASLQSRLREVDPDSARAIDPANLRRVVRALEVFEVTGRPFSSFRSAWESFSPVTMVGLDVADEALDARLELRLRGQVDAGLADEVRALLAAGFERAPSASRAVPYPQAVAFVRGEIDEETFIQEAVRSTRRLVRRQRAWFRRDPRVRWFEATDEANAEREVRAYLQQHIDGGDACAS